MTYLTSTLLPLESSFVTLVALLCYAFLLQKTVSAVTVSLGGPHSKHIEAFKLGRTTINKSNEMFFPVVGDTHTYSIPSVTHI